MFSAAERKHVPANFPDNMFAARYPKHMFTNICGTTCFRVGIGNILSTIAATTCSQHGCRNMFPPVPLKICSRAGGQNTCLRRFPQKHVFGPGAKTCLRRLAREHVSGSEIRTRASGGCGRTCFRPGRKNMFTTACSKTCFRTAGGNICSRGFRRQRVSCPEATTYVFSCKV